VNTQIFEKAQSKLRTGKYGEAIRLFQMVLMKEPRHLDANYLLGTTYAEAGRPDEARKYLLRAENIMPNSPFIKVNLGNVHKQQGSNEAAFICYLNALKLQHDLPEARHNLTLVAGLLEDESETAATACFEYGQTCLWDGRKEEALAIMRIGQALNPGDAHLGYFVALLEGKTPEPELQLAFARQEFDRIAPYFDGKLAGDLGYDAPRHIEELLKKVCGEPLHFNAVADLGCGTGLAGQRLRGYAERLIGIDISEKMLAEAETKGVYDLLLVGDAAEMLLGSEGDFDLFVAADVFIYIGVLEPLLKAVVAKAAPGALFVFTTEKGNSDDCELQLTGRYAHGRAYVEKVVQECACQVAGVEEIELRTEGDRWIMGDVFCIKVS
jgi:predicted TPR repeat methyltransferase